MSYISFDDRVCKVGTGQNEYNPDVQNIILHACKSGVFVLSSFHVISDHLGASSPEPVAPISVRSVKGSSLPLNSGMKAASV